ncbi:hypothetical protein XENOCAPTIV_000365, partial [Xenoophorus captivus]
MRGRAVVLSIILAAGFFAVSAQPIECEAVTVGDIVFLVDSSRSIGTENFKEVRTFLSKVIENLDIGPDKVRVGLAQYGTDPVQEFLLKDHMDKTSLLAAVDKITFLDSGTETGKAINFIRDRYFTAEAGSRASQRVPQIAVVMSDGESSDDVPIPAKRLREHGVLVFAIGVGSYNRKELEIIANHPSEDFVITSDTFQALQGLRNTLLKSVCTSLEAQREALTERFADIFFLVDSALPQRQYILFRNELIRFIDQLDVGQSSYRIGLAQYSPDVKVEFYLNAHKSQAQYTRAVKSLQLQQQPGQAQNLGGALEFAAADVFRPEKGGRANQGARQFLVVVLGKDFKESVFSSAKKVKSEGVTVVTMSVTVPIESMLIISTERFAFNTLRITQLMDVFTTEEVEVVTEDCRRVNTADIVFIINEAEGVGTGNFNLIRTFVQSLISSLNVDQTRVRVGIVTYSDTPRVHAYLNSLQDRAEALQLINLIPYRGGGTKTGAALRTSLDSVFTQKQGSRKDVQKVAIVITDGKSQDSVKKVAVELHRVPVRVFAIGVKQNTTELQDIASYPTNRHVFAVNSFTQLKPLRQILQKSICSVIIQGSVNSFKNSTDIKEACEQKDEANIFFLIDDSDSIDISDLSDTKEFITDFMKTFRIGPSQVRLGLVKYSDLPILQFDLIKYSSISDLKKALKNIQHVGGGTNTGRALASMESRLVAASRQGPTYLIVITAGRSADKVKGPAERIRAQDVMVFAVGVKNSNKAQLQEISGDPVRTFNVPDYHFLKWIKNDILRQICGPEVCKDAPNDIIFLTESSERISQTDFKKMKEFMKSTVNKSIVGLDDMRVGVMQFSTDHKLEFPLNKYSSKADILGAIDNMKQLNGGVATGRALSEVLKYFSASEGGRPNLRKNLVLITFSGATDEVKGPADDLRKSNVFIYSIGVVGGNYTQLSEISGFSDRVINEVNVDLIQELDGILALKFCDPHRECKKVQKADIIFLVDGSSSIDDKFRSMQIFMESIVKQTIVSRSSTRFGAILYSDDPEIKFSLNNFNSRGEVLNAIKALVPPSKNTYTGKALNYTLQFFNEEHGGRRRLNVPQILMVITDGKAQDHYQLEGHSNQLRAKNITVLSIGVQDANMNELLIMAGSNERVFFVEDFKKLETLHKNLSGVICNTTKPSCEQMDVVFLLDRSGSINTSNYQIMKNFTAEVVNSFKVAENLVHFGLAQFSEDPKDEFYLNQHYNQKDIVDKILQLSYMGGGTKLGKALHFVKKYFSPLRGSRSDVPQTLVVFSDGDSQDDVEDAGDDLRRSRIDVLAVAIGNVFDVQLLQITGDPRKIINVGNVEDLPGFKKKVVDAICKKSKDDPDVDPDTNCTIDIAIGFDISGGRAFSVPLFRLVSPLQEIVRSASTVSDLCCSASVQTRISFSIVDVDGSSLYVTDFETYNEDVLRKVLDFSWSQATFFNSALLKYFNVKFKSKSTAKVKILVIFSDGLDDNVLKLKQESELLRTSGVSALLTVALEDIHASELQTVEFRRGHNYQVPLSISLPSISSTILQHI